MPTKIDYFHLFKYSIKPSQKSIKIWNYTKLEDQYIKPTILNC